MTTRKPERIAKTEAALITGLPERTVLDLAAKGPIPGAAKLGRLWTFNETTLRAWISSKVDEVWQRSEKPRRAATGAVTRFEAASRLPASRSGSAFIQAMEMLRVAGSRAAVDDAYENAMGRPAKGKRL